MAMLTTDEAYAVAEFIDMIHAYEKCKEVSEYVGVTDNEEERDSNGTQAERR